MRNIERKGDGTLVVLLDDGRRIEAGSVVLAAGVHTRFLAAKLGEPIPLETERGYHTQIMKPGISMRYSVIWPHRAFMVTPTPAASVSAAMSNWPGSTPRPISAGRGCLCATPSGCCRV